MFEMSFGHSRTCQNSPMTSLSPFGTSTIYLGHYAKLFDECCHIRLVIGSGIFALLLLEVEQRLEETLSYFLVSLNGLNT